MHILALGKLRQEDFKLEVSLGYFSRFCLRTNKGWGDNLVFNVLDAQISNTRTCALPQMLSSKSLE